jgi:thiamine biosynthesis protein ThiS
MTAIVNSEPRSVAEGTTIGQLLRDLGIDTRGVAVARNEQVVRGTLFETEMVCEDDVIEIISAVAGG